LAARSLVGRFLVDQRGATAIEYGLIISLIFLVILTAVQNFGSNASNVIIRAANAIGGSV
jgi:pilus assembly protein Flp/PilA